MRQTDPPDKEVASDFKIFKQLVGPRLNHLRELIDADKHEQHWILRSVQSFEAFQQSFPDAEARAKAIQTAIEIDDMRSEVLWRLDRSLESFNRDAEAGEF